MLAQFLLPLHIIIAATTGTVVIYSLYKSLIVKSPKTTNLQKYLGVTSILSVLSGSLLQLGSSQSVAAFCAQIGLYMGIIICTQLVLFVKSRETQSLSAILLPQAANLLVTILTVGIINLVT